MNYTMMRNKAQVPKPGAGAQNYRRSIRAAVRGFWTGAYDMNSFISEMSTVIRRNLTFAWYEGAKQCGINPSELTSEEISQLNIEINKDMGYLIGFADAIRRGQKSEGGKLTPLLRRAELWANRYDAVRSNAMSYACRDKKLKWVWNPLKEHCGDCMRLNGRVYRASIWRKYDIKPRMRSLACHGYNCGCMFVETDEPATPGRPPSIGGI